MTTFQTSNGNLFHWHGVVPSRHEQIAGGSTVLSGDGLWTSFTIHPPNYPRFVEWAERDIGPTVLDGPRNGRDPVYVGEHRHELMAVVARVASVTSRAELIEEGQARGLLVTPVNEVCTTSPRDAHLRARRLLRRRRPAGRGADRAGRFAVPLRPRPRATWAGAAARRRRRSARATGRPVADGRRAGRRGRAPPTAERHPHRRLHVGDRRIVRHPAARRPRRGRHQDRVREPARPGPPHRSAADRQRLARHQRRVPGLLRRQAGGHDQHRTRPRARSSCGSWCARPTWSPRTTRPTGWTGGGSIARRWRRCGPGLIVANLAVMGLSGPDAGWRSYGNGLVAMSGVAAHTGFDGRVPQCLGTMHTDFTVPYFAAMQILAALHHRDRTGEGCYLELSQYESSVRLMDVELADVLNGGEGPGRIANRSPWCAPHGIFPAAGDDRWVAIACRDDARAGPPRGGDRRAARRRDDGRVDEPTQSRGDRACAAGRRRAGERASRTSATTTRIEHVRAVWSHLTCRRGSSPRSSTSRSCGTASGCRCVGRRSGWSTPTRCSSTS